MFFASDNAGPVHPKVMAALAHANEGYASSYGNDPVMDDVRARIRAIFEAPDASVHLVATGTAANALLLATMARPWDSIFCTPMSHINEDECNAPEFFTGGAKLTLVDTVDAKMTPQTLRDAMGNGARPVHSPQRGPVSITQVTERGTVHALDELRALTAVAREQGLKTHLDGARFANALVALGCSAADMTWKAGIDAVSFGGTKNGLMAVEAAIIFDPSLAWEFELRRKRGAHLFSKHRYLSAQMQAYLTDDLWLTMAARANAACHRLAQGLRGIAGVELLFQPDANMIFAQWPRAAHKRLLDAGAVYYVLDGDPHVGDPAAPLSARLVCDWSMTDAGVDRFLSLLRG